MLKIARLIMDFDDGSTRADPRDPSANAAWTTERTLHADFCLFWSSINTSARFTSEQCLITNSAVESTNVIFFLEDLIHRISLS